MSVAAIIRAGSTGDLSLTGRVRVEGHHTGRLDTDDLLEVVAGGVIDGDVQAATVVIAGVVNGNICAHELLRIESTGRVAGLVDAPQAEIRIGAQLVGQVRIKGEQ